MFDTIQNEKENKQRLIYELCFAVYTSFIGNCNNLYLNILVRVSFSSIICFANFRHTNHSINKTFFQLTHCLLLKQ